MDHLGVIRFGHRTLLAQLFGILDSTRDSSRQQNIQSGSMLSDPLRQAKSVDGARHFDITENNVHDRLFVREHGRTKTSSSTKRIVS